MDLGLEDRRAHPTSGQIFVNNLGRHDATLVKKMVTELASKLDKRLGGRQDLPAS